MELVTHGNYKHFGVTWEMGVGFAAAKEQIFTVHYASLHF